MELAPLVIIAQLLLSSQSCAQLVTIVEKVSMLQFSAQEVNSSLTLE